MRPPLAELEALQTELNAVTELAELDRQRLSECRQLLAATQDNLCTLQEKLTETDHQRVLEKNQGRFLKDQMKDTRKRLRTITTYCNDQHAVQKTRIRSGAT